ncbi:MAG: metallophosphoesterase family protein [Tangfeifania sp.]
MKKLFFLIFVAAFFSCSNERTVRFAVCTDVHHDLIHDGSDKLSTFIKTAKKEKADFIIQLGDFCMPYEKNGPFLKIWNEFERPRYHVLGNHDMDVSPKIVTQQFLGLEKSYYSFDHGDFHFIVLDANFFKSGDRYFNYQNGNYFNHAETRAQIPPVQLEWLKKDLAETDKYTIVFSHQSLEHWGGIKNRKQVRQIFREANRDKKKVIACFCGHDHSDRYLEIDGIHYIGLNSMSYVWVGKKLEYSGRFPEKIEAKYSNLKYTLPFRNPVFAVVEVNSNGEIKIEGIQSSFIPPDPEELGAKNHNYSAKISNRTLYF